MRDQQPRAMIHSARLLRMLMLVVAVACGGCNRGPQIVPVRGLVTYEGKPLEYGTITFQPAQGQPAKGVIQPDGSFVLSTFRQGDGAVVGEHKVRVTCYESQRPGAQPSVGEQTLGKLLIPRRYTLFDQSGLTADVNGSDNQPIEFHLTE